MTLEDCRKKIDLVDREIIALLNQRAGIVSEIGEIKVRAGLPIVDWSREMEILKWVARENEGIMRDEAAARIFRCILQESRQIQAVIAEELNAADEVCR
jgi:Chorismate mutase